MKKVTLFLDKTLQTRLAKDRSWSVAYRSALDSFAKIVAYGSDPRFIGPIAQVCERGFAKYVCGCHSESNIVRDVFAKANRIEACLTFRWHSALTLEISAYRTGEKWPFHQFTFCFNRDGIPVVASG